MRPSHDRWLRGFEEVPLELAVLEAERQERGRAATLAHIQVLPTGALLRRHRARVHGVVGELHTRLVRQRVRVFGGWAATRPSCKVEIGVITSRER